MPSDGKRSLNLLALAVACHLVVSAAVATAQTAIVRNAPEGSSVELVVNGKPAGTATVNAAGDAVVTSDLSANTGKNEIDAHIYVDICSTVRRVIVGEPGVQPPPAGEGCTRTEIGGLFVVRRASTFVVNVGAAVPTVILRQGQVSLAPPRVWAPAPTGVALFGGGGFAKFGSTIAVACGRVTDCDGEDFRGALAAGLVYWFTRNFAVEGSFMKPGEVTVSGSEENFRFNSTLDAEVMAVAGKVGFPFGPVRIYGQIGTNYHRATFGTTQTSDEVTRTIDGVTQTIPGGTQTFDLRTAGWGWQFGGGIEVWVTRYFALYGEFDRAALKGEAQDEADGALDERLTSTVFGVRVRLGG